MIMLRTQNCVTEILYFHGRPDERILIKFFLFNLNKICITSSSRIH